jgi:hypothetical protein
VAGLAILSPARDPTPAFKRWGSGEFRRFGFLVYEATLWAGGDPLRPPLALKLTYKRNIAGQRYRRGQRQGNPQARHRRRATSAALGRADGEDFPDVARRPHHRPYRAEGARFHFQRPPLGSIDDPAFARAFFAIWLDPNQRARLRAALLKRPTA